MAVLIQDSSQMYFCASGNTWVHLFLFLFLLASLLAKEYLVFCYDNFLVYNLNQDDLMFLRSYSGYGLFLYCWHLLHLRAFKIKSQNLIGMVDTCNVNFVDDISNKDMTATFPTLSLLFWLAGLICRIATASVSVFILANNPNSSIAILKLILSIIGSLKYLGTWTNKLKNNMKKSVLLRDSRSEEDFEGKEKCDPFWIYFHESYKPVFEEDCQRCPRCQCSKKVKGYLFHGDPVVASLFTLAMLIPALGSPSNNRAAAIDSAMLMFLVLAQILAAHYRAFVKSSSYELVAKKDLIQCVSVKDARIFWGVLASAKYRHFLRAVSQELGLRTPAYAWLVKLVDQLTSLFPCMFLVNLSNPQFGANLPARHFWLLFIYSILFGCCFSVFGLVLKQILVYDRKSDPLTRDQVERAVLRVFGVKDKDSLNVRQELAAANKTDSKSAQQDSEMVLMDTR
eukprot:TRINITY_DN877_c0_g1_i2.p1 TRINITY_DN877_c0_g1~~TRINITY_DN877_c0_g1_i2.p1  ORF type:complete len:454 (-),score=83.18 TRINITY_DN877_c0_g1_i2:929-2290(-)